MMATFEDEIMGKHFELAGVKDDEPVPQASRVDDDQQGEVKEEKKEGSDEAELNLLGDEKKLNTDEKAKEQATGDQQQAAADKDKPSSGTDGKPKQGEEEKGKAAADPRDLTLADGTVVKAGRERRWYEDAQISKREVGAVKQELNTYKQKYEALEGKIASYEEAAKQLGVADPVEAGKAMRLYKDLRADPVATAKQLLVDLKAAGYSIDTSGAGGVDTQAIIALIDQKLGHIKPSVEAEQPNEVAVEVATFYNTFQDARLHDAFLAAVIEANPDASLTDAYRELKQAAIEHGYDWSKPLQPQIDAKLAKDKEQKPAEQQQQGGPAPINGKHLDDPQGFDPAKSVIQAASTEDAIRAAMRENGYNVQ